MGRILHGRRHLFKRRSCFLDRRSLLLGAAGKIARRRQDFTGTGIDDPGIFTDRAQCRLQRSDGFVEIAAQTVKPLGKGHVQTAGHVALRKFLQPGTQIFNRETDFFRLPRLLCLVLQTFPLAEAAIGLGFPLQALSLDGIVAEYGNGRSHFPDLVLAARMRNGTRIIACRQTVHGAGDVVDRTRNAQETEECGNKRDRGGDKHCGNRGEEGKLSGRFRRLLVRQTTLAIILDHLFHQRTGGIAHRRHAGNLRPRCIDIAGDDDFFSSAPMAS